MRLECHAGGNGTQVVGQGCAGPRSVYCAARQRPVHTGAGIHRRKHPAVAGGALVHIHRQKAMVIQRQTTVGQPLGCLRAGGQYWHVAGRSKNASSPLGMWASSY